MELSIVIISKNQAGNIGRLIESVLDGSSTLASREILLVDSASTDDTVASACQYPISVLRLSPGQQLCAAAGRHTGFVNTSGRYVLFLDGDMELCRGWLESALSVLRSSVDVAVVTGLVVDVLPSEAASDRAGYAGHASDDVREIAYGGGAALYKRSVLQEVGGFNPYLYSDEEPELCIRIRHAGYRIMELQRPIAFHYSQPCKALLTVIGRWRRRLYLGAGQSIRYHLGGELLWPYLRERGYGLAPGFYVLIFFVAACWSTWSHNWLLLGLIGTLGMIVSFGDALRKRSVYQMVVSLVHRAAILDGTVRGFLMKPRTPSTYAPRCDFTKRAPN